MINRVPYGKIRILYAEVVSGTSPSAFAFSLWHLSVEYYGCQAQSNILSEQLFAPNRVHFLLLPYNTQWDTWSILLRIQRQKGRQNQAKNDVKNNWKHFGFGAQFVDGKFDFAPVCNINTHNSFEAISSQRMMMMQAKSLIDFGRPSSSYVPWNCRLLWHQRDHLLMDKGGNWFLSTSRTHTQTRPEVTFIVFIEAIQGKPTHWRIERSKTSSLWSAVPLYSLMH